MPECFYHLYNRGNNRQTVFFERDNYIYFLQQMRKHLLPAADIVAYCLMPTHYHIMIRVKQTSEVSETSEVSLGMMKLGVSYTKAINKRFGRAGVLFQGQFQAKPVTDSSQLLQLCRYIHANPAKDGLVRHPTDWPYSNYLEWLGERKGSLVDIEFVRANFAEPGSYQAFVEEYVEVRYLPDEVQRHLEGMDE